MGQTKYNYEYAEAWGGARGDDLRPGTSIEGRIVSIETGMSNYGKYPILTIQPDEGDAKAVHCFHTALRSQLARVKPKVGAEVGIMYLGTQRQKAKVRGVSDYHNYRVIFAGDGGYDWSSEPGAANDEDVPF